MPCLNQVSHFSMDSTESVEGATEPAFNSTLPHRIDKKNNVVNAKDHFPVAYEVRRFDHA